MARKKTEQSGLGGDRALDLTDEKGFLWGKLLADLGGDGIKDEPPGGEPSRDIGPFLQAEQHPEENLVGGG